MKRIIFYGFALSALLFNVSCETDFETDVKDIQVTSGSADFSRYVALGNSLTSGYRDGALYIDAQNESYPNMIAQQMMLAGGGEFKQPLMADNFGGIPSIGVKDKYNLVVNNGALAPYQSPTISGTTTLANIYGQGPYQNLGAPGAKSYHLLFNGYGNPSNLALGMANPYYVRFASSANSSILEDAMAQNPTFFSLWIGNMDVLGYATAGGADPNNPITDEATFEAAYTGLINTLTSGGAKGVVANIPNVTSIPFFTRVPYNPLTPQLLGANISTLNTNLYGPLKQALTAFGAGDRINLLSETSANPVLIKDVSLQNLSVQLTAALTPVVGPQSAAAIGLIFGQARQATADDLILLPTSTVIGSVNTSPSAPAPLNVFGISYPLEDSHVLTQTEADAVLAATATFNAKIKELADAKGLAFFDANAKMVELSTNSGITWDGVKYTAAFVTGGTFSLDGIHPTGRGYAIVANEFISAINRKYGSTLPLVNANSYSGVQFP